MTDGILVTPEHIALHPTLFEPKRIKRDGKEIGEPIFSYSGLFDPADMAAIKAKAAEVAHAKWPGRNLGELKVPWTDGSQMKAKLEYADKKKGRAPRDYDFYDGKVVLKTKSQFAPGVVGPNKQPLLDKSQIYSGCYCFIEVNIVAYDAVNEGAQDGVTAYLNHVMKSRDGKRIIGRTAEDVFSGVKAPAGAAASGDPFGSSAPAASDWGSAPGPSSGEMDDEIPF